jgi:hypothetical protein
MNVSEQSTPAENVKLVLAAYKHYHIRAGSVLFAKSFQEYGAAKALSPEDVKSGLAYGYEQKWFEDGPNGSTKLTEEGYKEL